MYLARTEGVVAVAGGCEEDAGGVGCRGCWEDLLESSPWSISRNFWSSASAEEEGDSVGGVCCCCCCCCAGGAASDCVYVVAGRGVVSAGLPEEAAEEGEDQNQPIVSILSEGESCRVQSGSVRDAIRGGEDGRRFGMRRRFKDSIDKEQSSVFELNRKRGNKASMR